jgi:hypothetical protein
MNDRHQDEYRALRATIRTRGATRVWIFVVGIIAWAAIVLAELAIEAPPAIALVALLTLAAAFEGVFALHVGIERIGRYLQVFHEDRWEHTAMHFGAPLAGTGADPVFSLMFLAAAVLNLLTAFAADATPVEWSVLGVFHALFAVRVVTARRASGRQRAADLARFEQLKTRS